MVLVIVSSALLLHIALRPRDVILAPSVLSLLFNMTPDQLETLRILCKRYRITFNGRQSSNEWPIAHASLFANVRELGDTKYNIYAKSKENSSPDEPWGAHVITRADRLVEIAERCRLECRNEAGWRLALEHEVFSRFEVEVAW